MYCLFVDLDGVLVDFDGGVRAVTGSDPHDLSPRSMWPRLARTPGFYEHLDWLSGGRRLWSELQSRKPTILTGLPMGRWAEPQKRAWCSRELGPGTKVITCMSRQKAEKAGEATPDEATPVLIDDRASLRDRFEEAGGLFIHYTGVESALTELESLGGPFVEARV